MAYIYGRENQNQKEEQEHFDAKHQIGQICNTSDARKHTYQLVTPCVHIN